MCPFTPDGVSHYDDGTCCSSLPAVHTENLATVKSQLAKQAGIEVNGGADSHRKHFTGFANLQPSIHHNKLKDPTNADVKVKQPQTAQEEVRKEQPVNKVEKDTNAEVLKVQEKQAEPKKYNRVGWLMPYDEHPNS